VVVAADQPLLVVSEHAEAGAAVVDVGIHRLAPDPAAGPACPRAALRDVRFRSGADRPAITPVARWCRPDDG